MDKALILDYTIRIISSMIFGALLGIERRSRQNPVGIRTMVLISLSCCLLSILSAYLATSGVHMGDPTRIASTTVTGIGFIGGGAILKQGLNIRGLTTAAIILMAAALGLSCGAGLYIPSIITVILSLFILFIMNKFEKKLFPLTKTKILNLKLEGSDINHHKIEQILKANGLVINDINMEYIAKKDQTELSYTVKTPYKLDPLKLANQLGKVEKLINFTLNDRS